ncbi:MuDRA-like transposase [Cucumis melo var. makuwa]|uniref:MuDRA-like transposase n=1 Tax=Cucumis melo var. makuwa TaxID=1194695 RepID=A0A5A7UWI2_CUCMM|nr:MuDRA-like transposase [Cucumis melo var. makuwa]TYK22092.1 MuDRA-like transposase [Cucumis melo var. makuwa]
MDVKTAFLNGNLDDEVFMDQPEGFMVEGKEHMIHHGVNVSYAKAWRGREVALNFIRGTPKASYAMLSAFSNALIRNNLGTYTTEEANDEVDGAIMKNKYLGRLISSNTLDGNSQIMSLVFAIVVQRTTCHRSYTPLEFEYYMRKLDHLSVN